MQKMVKEELNRLREEQEEIRNIVYQLFSEVRKLKGRKDPAALLVKIGGENAHR